MNPDSPKTPREAMETWITSLLLGELSAGETAAVRELIKHDPELAKLHDDLKSTIHLVREVTVSAAEPTPVVQDQPKLSTERREKLLAQFKTVIPKEFASPQKRRSGLRLLEIAAVLAILALLAAMMLPALGKAKSKAQSVAVRSNLKQIELAKQMWAEDNKKSAGTALTMEDLGPYLNGRGQMPSVGGETYVVGKVGEPASAEIAASDAKKTFWRVSASLPRAGRSEFVRLSADGQVSVVDQTTPTVRTALPKAEAGQLAFRTRSLDSPATTPSHEVPDPGNNYFNRVPKAQPPTDAPAAQPPPPPRAQIVLPAAEAAPDFGASPQNSGQTLGEPKWIGGLEKVEKQHSAFDASFYRYAGGAALPIPSVVQEPARALNAPAVDPATGLPVSGTMAVDATPQPETRTDSLNKETLRQETENLGEAFRRGYVPAQTSPTIPRFNVASGGGGGGTVQPAFSPLAEINGAPTGQHLSDVARVSLGVDEGKIVHYDDLNGGQVAGATLQAVDESVAARRPRTLAEARPEVKLQTKFTEIMNNDNRALGFDWYLGNQVADGTSGLAGQGRAKADAVGQPASEVMLQGVTTIGGRAAQVPSLGEMPAMGRVFTNSIGDEARGVTPIADGGRLVPESNVYSLDVVGYTDVNRKARSKKSADLNSIEQQITQRTEELEKLRRQLHASDLDASGTPPQPLIEQEEYKRFMSARFEREVTYTGHLEEFQKLSALNKKELRDVLPGLETDPTLTELINELNAADQKFKSLGNDISEKHPEYIRITDQQKLLNQKIDDRVTGILKKLETQLAVSKSELDSLVESVETARKLDQEKLTTSRPYYDKKRELETLRRTAGIDVEDAPVRKPATNAPIPQPEIQTSENNFSTFSLNVSDVSFKLAAASLEKGQMPDVASIRSEEFINAFDYRDPEPTAGSPIASAWERARYPFAHNRDLLRFSLKTAAAGRQAGRPLNIVLLLDNSGSMERADRVQIIREALKVLAAQLQPQDKLSVITFARTARLVADGISGDQAGAVAEQVSGITPEGGTNLEDAMNLAYQTAAKHYLANGINRVVLLTDGAANLGDVEPGSLKQKVEAARQQGIALDCFGIGWEGFNDDLLEVLSRNGDGRYGFINSPEEAATDFAGQLAGALKVAASDVKVQVEFNPKRVTSYRQIGYAKHQLTKEQFRDNTVDAAEIAAQEAGNALYTVEVNPAGEGPLCIVRVRYKVPGTTDYREQAWDVPFSGNVPALEQSSPAMRLAASAAAFAEWLVASPFAGEVSPDGLLSYLRGVPEVFGADSRPKKLEWMIRQAKSIEGK